MFQYKNLVKWKMFILQPVIFTLLLSGCSGGESEPREEDLDEIPIYPDEIPLNI